MRLIDVDALIEKHCEGCSKDIQEGCKTDPVCATLMWFEDAPTIDAVPVVRCKDCKHCDVLDKKKQMLACPYYEGRGVQPEHFCGDGERKDGDTIG